MTIRGEARTLQRSREEFRLEYRAMRAFYRCLGHNNAAFRREYANYCPLGTGTDDIVRDARGE